MADFGKFDISGFKELQKKLQKLQANKDKFAEECIKALAQELLRRVIKRTPVGYYGIKEQRIAKKDSKNHKKGDVYYVKKGGSDGKNGGNLRRNWRMKIHRSGKDYVAVISNAVPYAIYVEYGHRQTPGRFVPALGKRLVKSWVPGKFMLTISEQELNELAPIILKKKFDEFLGGI